MTRPEFEPILDAEVTEEAVARWFAHRIHGKVTRWRLPGIHGFNFLLRQALGGGGMASIKADPLAKAFAQMLLDMPVHVPDALAKELIAYCRSHLADVKCPRSVDFREELPRHPTGKLYKRILKDEYQSMYLKGRVRQNLTD